MNRQSTAGAAPCRTAPRNDNPMNRKKPDPALLRFLQKGMWIVGALIVLAGLLLLILPIFRVNEVKVIGNAYYHEDEIKVASQISLGQEILSLNSAEISERIYQNCPYVKSVKILCTPFSVKIEITEFETVMYTKFNGSYYSLNRDLRVIEESADEVDFAGFLRVELPTVSALAVGSTLRFADEETDVSYLGQLLDELEKNGTLDDVTAVDVSHKYNVSYVLNDACRVELGKVGNTTVKLLLVDEILSRKGGESGSASVVNVSDPQKPTYRPASNDEVLLAK